MQKSKSNELISKYENPARNELNLIGLKSRFALVDRPDQCKNICNSQSIKFSRTYGRNIFEKLNYCRNTFKDFDHIIVPKYMKKQSLQELISKEKDNLINKLTSFISRSIPQQMQLKKRTDHKQQSPLKAICPTSERVLQQQLIDLPLMPRSAVKKRNRGQSKKLIMKKKEEEVTSVDKGRSKEMGQSGVIDSNNWTRTFFDKNEYVITSRGGVMHTASILRKKKINVFLPSSPATKASPRNESSEAFNSLKPFESKFKVKNLERYIKEV